MIRIVLLLVGSVSWQFRLQAQEKLPLWSAPPLEQAISIRNGHSGERLTFQQFLAQIAPVDAVFLGESHTDETTHRLQVAVYEGLLEARGQQVVLALEMFARDVQSPLDQYLAGNIEESAFLATARPWPNYREAYRPLIERAKQAGTPVVAGNFPARLSGRLARQGPEVLHTLSVEEQEWVPQQFYPNTPAYWKRVDNALRGHQGFGMPGNAADQRLYSTQSLWDNSMGEACADALERHPGWSVLHLNGKFHSDYWDGTVHQLRQRRPQARIKTVTIIPVLNPATARWEGQPVADYVVYAAALATNGERGQRTVQVGGELKYRLHLPKNASLQTPAPLLIWFPEEGLTAAEGLAFCQQQFGEEVAIAVMDAPYPAVGADSAVGGRWYWPETFAEDVQRAVTGTERMWAYLLRHFPLDASRVCLVGQGTGGTVAAAIAVHATRMQQQALAIRPRRYSQLKDLPLPLPESWGAGAPPEKTLCVVAEHAQQGWWEQELAQCAHVSSAFHALAADPWEAERQQTNRIRQALGLAQRPAVATERRHYLLLEDPAPRAWHWAQLQAMLLTKSSGIPTVVVDKVPQHATARQVPLGIVARAGVLPKCPGPFGGTTVLVLPHDVNPEQRVQWSVIEKNDPLAAASPFHRLRVATDRSLPSVLEKLRSENRHHILIVPAVFFADFTWLQQLRRSALEYEDSLTLHWLPGLGGRPGVLENSTDE